MNDTALTQRQRLAGLWRMTAGAWRLIMRRNAKLWRGTQDGPSRALKPVYLHAAIDARELANSAMLKARGFEREAA